MATTKKKKNTTPSRRALAAKAERHVGLASGLTSSVGRWNHEQEIEARFAMLPTKAQKALLRYLDARYASADVETAVHRLMSHPRYDYGDAPVPAWVGRDLTATARAENAARKRFMQLATGKTRKARKASTKKRAPARKKK